MTPEKSRMFALVCFQRGGGKVRDMLIFSLLLVELVCAFLK